MKTSRWLLALFLIIAPIITNAPNAVAEPNQNIVLVDLPHRDFQGNFFADDFASSLLPTGALGVKVFTPVARPRTWLIDPALIDDVQTLALKNVDAQNWLVQLKTASSLDPVLAVPYAHPDLSMMKRLAPNELNYYFDYSKKQLQKFLGVDVAIDKSALWSSGYAKVTSEAALSYTYNRRALVLMSTVIPVEQLDPIRSKLAVLLSAGISPSRQSSLASSADQALTEERHRLRIVGGNYRLTSLHEKVPVTLVNEFDAPVIVNVHLGVQNSRIKVAKIGQVTLPAKSKTQVFLQITVIASGTTTVLAEYRNNSGKTINDVSILTINSSVISPAVAWFTTGAAIILFLAAITQSVRRVRRSRK